MKELHIAVIGVGWIGRIHSECYLRISQFLSDVNIILDTVVDIIEDSAIDAKNRYGFLKYTTKWEETIKDDKIDIIDICVDNMYHNQIALEAAANGKHIVCEKPLANGINEAKDMVEAARKAGIKNIINFNYRKVPALSFIKELVKNKELGEIYHISGVFQQDFGFNSPMSWRFKKEKAGGGSIITMGSHLIDLGRFLVGEYMEVVSTDSTFINNRENIKTGQFEACDVDDAFAFICRFENGALGSFLTSWVSHGRKHHCGIEVYGSKGSAYFNSERINEIGLFLDSKNSVTNGIRNILIGEDHKYGKLFSLKTGMGIGIKESFTIQLYEFILAIIEDSITSPDFSDGLEVEKVTHAVIQSSINRNWVNVN